MAIGENCESDQDSGITRGIGLDLYTPQSTWHSDRVTTAIRSRELLGQREPYRYGGISVFYQP